MDKGFRYNFEQVKEIFNRKNDDKIVKKSKCYKCNIAQTYIK